MSGGSLVDPSFELVDPCPDIHALFIKFNARFFGGSLACCEVKWSPRMYSCAGICSYEIRGGRGGLCSIRLSKPLLQLRPRKDLVETLLHEMIHAFLFVKERNRDRDGHGPHFQSHMHRINKEAGTNITIYHTFHQEVALYKQHWWRCDGVCKDKRPFFGYIKRSSNRAPGPNDLWWAAHQESCRGKFIKIKEPDGYKQKKRKASKTETESDSSQKAPKKSPQKTLDNYFVKPTTSSSNNRKVGGGNGNGNSKIGTRKVPEINETKKTGVSVDQIVPFSGAGQRLGGGTSGSASISTLFGGTGQRLGGGSSSSSSSVSKNTGPSRGGAPKRQNVGTSSGNSKKNEVVVIDLDDDDDVVFVDGSASTSIASTSNFANGWTAEDNFTLDGFADDLEMSFVVENGLQSLVICPSCNEQVSEEVIHAHLDHCLA